MASNVAATRPELFDYRLHCGVWYSILEPVGKIDARERRKAVGG